MRTKLSMMVVMAALVCAGCASFQQNAGKTLASIATTVDAAMKSWATYVVVTGKATPAQEAQVKGAYAQYQAAMTSAVAAYGGLSSAAGQPAWNQALATLTGVQTTLLQLVQALTQTGGAK
jgi:hypothetical protein